MKHLILILVISFSVLLNAGAVSFVQYIENNATFYPFDGTEPQELKIGLPLYPGDKISTERNTFLEIVLSDQNLLWVGSFSDLELRAISGTEGYPDKRTYLFLSSGEIAYEALNTPPYDEEPVIGFAQGDLYILGQGVYYVNISRGNARIMIIDGKAEIATSLGSVYLRSGEEANVFNDGYVDRKRISLKNEFFVEMVEQRRALRYKSQSSRYTGTQFSSSNYVLDSYGSWIYEPEFSLYVWRPTVVVGWSPYYYGYWRWTPHGWFWVSYEPWGYLTYHYGRWVWTPRYGWVWVPGYTWAPAWVYWVWFDFFIGWCPMGYYDYWWYYRWDWWWNWPPCWYNDCYFGFKGRIHLKPILKDHWVFADGRTFGKTKLEIHKDLKIDLKGKDGLIYAINLPVEPKDVHKLDEHFIVQKNILKNDLTPVFKINEKPSLEAKNILSSSKETISKEKTFLRVDENINKRKNVFEDLKPSRSLKNFQNFEKSKGRQDFQPRVLERKELGKEVSPEKREKMLFEKERPKTDLKREPVKVDEPKRDLSQPKNIEKKDESEPIKRDFTNNYYQKNTPSREPVYIPETKREEIKERTPNLYQPQYYRNPEPSSQTPYPNNRNYSPASPDKRNTYEPSYRPNYNSPSRPNTPAPSPEIKVSPTPSSSSPSPSSSSHSTSSSSSHSSSSSKSNSSMSKSK